ncbi:MAG: hypothetical protein ACOYN0_00930 [Phycisphaerales bacterium]
MITLLKRLRDDRGCELRRLTDTELKGDGEHLENRRKLIKRLRAGVRSAGRRQNGPQAAAIACVLLGLAAGGTLSRTYGTQGLVAGFALGIGASICATYILTRRNLAAQVAASAVAEGFCGACAQSLRDLVPEEDGCIRCSECGAAWKHLRITSPHWAPQTEYQKRERFGRMGWFGRQKKEMVTDAYGRFIPGLGSSVRSVPKATRRTLGPGVRRTLGWALWRQGLVRRIFGIVGAGVVFFAPAALAVSSARGGGDVVPLAVMCSIPGIVACLVVLMLPMAKPERYARVMVEHGVCGSCGGLLAGLPAQPDGCVVCPECRAAWKVRGV